MPDEKLSDVTKRLADEYHAQPASPPASELKFNAPPAPEAPKARNLSDDFLQWCIRNDAHIIFPKANVKLDLSQDQTVQQLLRRKEEICERSDLGPVHD